jgi:hypothetical protein
MKRLTVRLAALVSAGLAACGLLASAEGVAAAAGQPFVSSVFLATHNSYSGNLDNGERRSIQYQLDHGVRFVELDIHDNGYDTNHDYVVGHDSAGDKVDPVDNPASNRLWDWLNVIASWSFGHPSAAPLVVMLDLKDDLTDNPSFAAGNLTALNEEVRNAFGGTLLRPADYPAGQPTVDALRGRVMVLLSGDTGSRTEYRADVGFNPAVAINGNGQVVEVHDSGAGWLWYWTGSYGADGRITWLRHGRYDTGVTPAVALNDNGDLVEVHQSQSATTLWYRVGHLDGAGEISWGPSHQFDNGVLPTIAFTGTSTLREIHRSQNNSQNWTWTGTLSTGSATVSFSGNAKTSSPRFDKTTSASGAGSVTAFTASDGPTPAQALRYSTDRIFGERIRYQQTAFVEFQNGDSALLRDGALFYGAPATDKQFMITSRQAGHPVRGWDFDSAGLATTPLATYPATNHPWDAWYQTMMTQAGAVQ